MIEVAATCSYATCGRERRRRVDRELGRYVDQLDLESAKVLEFMPRAWLVTEDGMVLCPEHAALLDWRDEREVGGPVAPGIGDPTHVDANDYSS